MATEDWGRQWLPLQPALRVLIPSGLLPWAIGRSDAESGAGADAHLDSHVVGQDEEEPQGTHAL